MTYNIHDFLSKIDWEGGVYGALEYGLTVGDYELPQQIIDKWNEIRDMFNEISDLVNEFEIASDKVADVTPFEED